MNEYKYIQNDNICKYFLDMMNSMFNGTFHKKKRTNIYSKEKWDNSDIGTIMDFNDGNILACLENFKN